MLHYEKRTDLHALIDKVLQLRSAKEVLRYQSLIAPDYELYARYAHDILTAHIKHPIPSKPHQEIYIATREYIEHELEMPDLAQVLDELVDIFYNYEALYLIKKALQRKLMGAVNANDIVSKIMHFIKKHYTKSATYDLLLMPPQFLALSNTDEDKKSCLRHGNTRYFASILNYPFDIFYGALFRNKKYMGRFWVIRGDDFHLTFNFYPLEIAKEAILKGVFGVSHIHDFYTDTIGVYVNDQLVFMATNIEDKDIALATVNNFFRQARDQKRFRRCAKDDCDVWVDLDIVRNADPEQSAQAYLLKNHNIIMCEVCANYYVTKCVVCGKRTIVTVNGKYHLINDAVRYIEYKCVCDDCFRKAMICIECSRKVFSAVYVFDYDPSDPRCPQCGGKLIEDPK